MLINPSCLWPINSRHICPKKYIMYSKNLFRSYFPCLPVFSFLLPLWRKKCVFFKCVVNLAQMHCKSLMHACNDLYFFPIIITLALSITSIFVVSLSSTTTTHSHQHYHRHHPPRKCQLGCYFFAFLSHTFFRFFRVPTPAYYFSIENGESQKDARV